MLIRDLPTKRVLVRRRDGKLYYQRYHYRPELIPDEAFSLAVERALGNRLDHLSGRMRVRVGDVLLTGAELAKLDLPPCVVVPSAMRDWERAKAKVIERASLWAFPMRLHLTDEYLQKVAQGIRDEKEYEASAFLSYKDTLIERLAILYTYSSSEEALQFLRRLGEDTLRKREPIDWSGLFGWSWLELDYSQLETLLEVCNKVGYLVPVRDSGKGPYDAYIKCDYRLLWRHVREWLPLLVDINARQFMWQLEEARRHGFTPRDWALKGSAFPNTPEKKLVTFRIEKLIFMPFVDKWIRQHLSGDALQYYDEVYNLFHEGYRDDLFYSNIVYRNLRESLDL